VPAAFGKVAGRHLPLARYWQPNQSCGKPSTAPGLWADGEWGHLWACPYPPKNPPKRTAERPNHHFSSQPENVRNVL